MKNNCENIKAKLYFWHKHEGIKFTDGIFVGTIISLRPCSILRMTIVSVSNICFEENEVQMGKQIR